MELMGRAHFEFRLGSGPSARILGPACPVLAPLPVRSASSRASAHELPTTPGVPSLLRFVTHQSCGFGAL